MKNFLIGLALLLSASAANANFFGGNDGEWKMGPNGAYWDESDWPQWTPMYWMEEMMDNFSGDSNNFGFNGSSNNYPMPGGYPQMPQANYGYPQQAPVAPAPVAPAPVAPVTK